MIGSEHSLTRGYVLRHIPPASGLGIEIAILDIAQDFLLAHLHELGILGDLAIFKGGTALRKLFAGAQGRFSTDLDLAIVEPDADRRAAAELIAEHARIALGPFRFEPVEARGRWQIRVFSDFGDPDLTIKLDVGPPCWLEPEMRPFVAHGTQRRYGFALPPLPCMQLEEVLAEKIARLARSATARDASDLVWAATTTPFSRFQAPLVRRLAVLKTWVDNHGMGPCWSAALAPRAFDAEAWLSSREEWDEEQIGLLTTPPPTLGQLEADLLRLYGWLRDMTDEEGRWTRTDAKDRTEVIHAIRGLPGSTLAGVNLW